MLDQSWSMDVKFGTVDLQRKTEMTLREYKKAVARSYLVRIIQLTKKL